MLFGWLGFLSFAEPSHANEQSNQNDEDAAALEGSAVNSIASDEPFKFVAFTLQNDAFVGDDSGYTNGLGVSFGRGPFLEFSEDTLPVHLDYLSRNLYIRTMPDKARGVAHMLFQRMQTPSIITESELQEDDVPWAGLFALQSILFAWDKDRSDQVSFFLGIVGPLALAEQAQRAVHSAIGADEPQGWDNQIENEFVFRLQARQARKLYTNYSERFGFDVIGIGEASLGTIQSDIQAGVAIRWGTNLKFSHATFNLQADRQVNSLSLSPQNDFFTYLGVQGGYVLNDILIDGNTFEDSHSVPLEHWQEAITAGVVWKRNRFAYVFQLTSSSSRTPFVGRRDSFGAFGITYPFK